MSALTRDAYSPLAHFSSRKQRRDAGIVTHQSPDRVNPTDPLIRIKGSAHAVDGRIEPGDRGHFGDCAAPCSARASSSQLPLGPFWQRPPVVSPASGAVITCRDHNRNDNRYRSTDHGHASRLPGPTSAKPSPQRRHATPRACGGRPGRRHQFKGTATVTPEQRTAEDGSGLRIRRSSKEWKQCIARRDVRRTKERMARRATTPSIGRCATLRVPSTPWLHSRDTNHNCTPGS
jgi:hypothetical protein